MASRPSEYGGKEGIIQRGEDGHVLSPAEEAMLMRRFGKLSNTEHVLNATEMGPMGLQVPAGADPIVGDPERDELIREMNGYSDEDLGVNQS